MSIPIIRGRIEDQRRKKSKTVTLPAVPRVGDAVCWGVNSIAFTVKSVIWVIAADDYDVVVRGW